MLAPGRLQVTVEQAVCRRTVAKMQQVLHDKTIYAPLMQLAFINGIGPRVGESCFGRIPLFPYTAPYEYITIKGT